MTSVKNQKRLEVLEAVNRDQTKSALEKYIPDWETMSDEEYNMVIANLMIADGEPVDPNVVPIWEHSIEHGFLALAPDDRAALLHYYQSN